MDRHQRHYPNPFDTAARRFNTDLPVNYISPYRALPTADQIQHERYRGQQAMRMEQERGGGGVHVAVPPTRQAAPMGPVQQYPFQPSNFAIELSSPPTKLAYERWEDFARRLYRLLNPNATPQDDNVIADWFDRDARRQYMETFRSFPYPDFYLRLGELLRRSAQMRVHGGHGGVRGVRHGEVHGVQRDEEFGVLDGEKYSVIHGEEKYGI